MKELITFPLISDINSPIIRRILINTISKFYFKLIIIFQELNLNKQAVLVPYSLHQSYCTFVLLYSFVHQ